MKNKPILKIVKVGGDILEDNDLLPAFLKNFNALKDYKILIHGGGKTATEVASKLGVVTTMSNGRRITDRETQKVVTMVYAGLINKTIVANLQAYGCNALGLSGADGNIIHAVKRPTKPIDYGYVGDVKKINKSLLLELLKLETVPVFCAITHDTEGNLLNTNADTIASEIACALTDHYSLELYYCFNKKGVLNDINDKNSLLTTISYGEYIKLLDENRLTDGMIPKMENSYKALKNNIHKVIIGDITCIVKESNVPTYTTLTL